MLQVTWSRRAINQLAVIWMNATDQNAVAAASQAIDTALANDPENEGESAEQSSRDVRLPARGTVSRVPQREARSSAGVLADSSSLSEPVTVYPRGLLLLGRDGGRSSPASRSHLNVLMLRFRATLTMGTERPFAVK
ncbi:hypothetical protein R5W23_001040 [Gemmata sp. JC673]|uniref:Uncharacterized protein n=1 Tax=Gemmata algarum TaxID=2975278 RepID=A0ABU5EY57_9BACT|nr:hypothetical protein [Gemmata algarum]MDY3559868.1 hypothetical protein [Gemmata algarum]